MRTKDKLMQKARRNIAADGGNAASRARRKRVAALRKPYSGIFAMLDGAAGDGTLSRALMMLYRERLRQIEEEGWTFEHDECTHDQGDLSRAAYCYLDYNRQMSVDPYEKPAMWPWSREWWKPCVGVPGKDDGHSGLVRETVKAGAMLLAEIDRLAAYSTSSLVMTAGGVVAEVSAAARHKCPLLTNVTAWQQRAMDIIRDGSVFGFSAQKAVRAAACAAIALAALLKEKDKKGDQ